jgi:hypothetical protein
MLSREEEKEIVKEKLMESGKQKTVGRKSGKVSIDGDVGDSLTAGLTVN